MPGLYKGAEAFFEGLRGPIATRSNQLGRQYNFQYNDDSKTDVEHATAKDSSLVDLVSTSLARAWLRNYDPSGLFPLAVAGREWWNQWTVSTRQQMIHIPNDAILRWKSLAIEAGATTVSRFDLVASWIQSVSVSHYNALFQLNPPQTANPSLTAAKSVSQPTPPPSTPPAQSKNASSSS